MNNTSLKWPIILTFMIGYSLSYASHSPQDDILYNETTRVWLIGQLQLYLDADIKWLISPSVHLMYLFNITLCSLLMWVFYVLCLDLGASVKKGVWMVFALGCSTPLAVYATHMWTQVFITLLMITCLRLLLRYLKSTTYSDLWKLGGCNGLACLVRYDSLIWVIPIYLVIFSHLIKLHHQQARPFTMKNIMALIAPLLSAFIIIILWNDGKLGNLTETAYLHQDLPYLFTDHFIFAFLFNILGTGQGIFIFIPLLWISIWGWSFLIKTETMWSVTALSICLIYLLFYSSFIWYEQANDWGPRFLIPIIPILLLPLVSIEFKPRWRFVSIHIMLVLGIIIQIIAIILPMNQKITMILMSYKPTSLWDKLLEPSEIWLCLQYGSWQHFWWMSSFTSLGIALLLLLVLSYTLYLLYIRTRTLSSYIKLLS